MASMALGMAGTAIGGPIGGMIGGAIGSYIDHLIFNHRNRHKPSVYDLTVVAASYGKPIPVPYGRAKMGGNVIMSSLLQETESTSSTGGAKSGKGGKGGGDKTAFKVTCAVAICKGPITNLWRVYADSKLIFDRSGGGPAFVSGTNPVPTPLSSYTELGTPVYGAIIDFSQADVDKGDDITIPSGGGTVYFGGETQPVDPDMQALVEQTYGTGYLCPAYLGTAYCVFKDFPLEKFGNRMPSWSFEVNGGPVDASPTVTLQSIVESICSDCGIDLAYVDASALTDDVLGYLVAGEASGRGVMEQLQEAYLFDLIEIDHKLVAKYRLASAAAPVMTIPKKDLGARTAPPGAPGEQPVPRLIEHTKQDFDLPQMLAIRFKSSAGNAYVQDFGFELGTSYAIKSGRTTTATGKISYDTSLVFKNTDVALIADKALRLIYLNRFGYELSLPPKYLALDPGDVVTLEYETDAGLQRTTDVYLQQVELGSDNTVRCVGVKTESELEYGTTSPPSDTGTIDDTPVTGDPGEGTSEPPPDPGEGSDGQDGGIDGSGGIDSGASSDDVDAGGSGDDAGSDGSDGTDGGGASGGSDSGSSGSDGSADSGGGDTR